LLKTTSLSFLSILAGTACRQYGETGGGMVSGGFSDDDGDVDDDMFEQAKQVVIESGKASTSFLQRRLSLGYSRAARIMDMLEAQGSLALLTAQSLAIYYKNLVKQRPTYDPHDEV
jgi:DNA segregation ATPase FtsK/SpoIIIE-like protein